MTLAEFAVPKNSPNPPEPDPPAAELAALRTEFAPIFAGIRASAISREKHRQLPFAEVERLKDSGFTRLRVPAEHGGRDISLPNFFALLVDLAAADSNVAHLLRGHIAGVERWRIAPASLERDRWLRRFGSGQLLGNAASERNATHEILAKLDRKNGQFRISGTKYYSTGSIYADWITTSASYQDQRYRVTVPAKHPGVTVLDDWDGFGQQLTASGTLKLDNVPVPDEDVALFTGGEINAGLQVTIFQAILLATGAGIARAAVNDATEFVVKRRRIFGQLGEHPPKEEPLVQATVGAIQAKAAAAESLVYALVDRIHQVQRLAQQRPEALPEAADRLALETFGVQKVVFDLVLAVTTELFEVGGASATSVDRAFDRHWRNARTVASHNPINDRLRALGDYILNDRVYLWGSLSDKTDTTSTHPEGDKNP